jgi:hypothetical protein
MTSRMFRNYKDDFGKIPLHVMAGILITMKDP